MRVLVVTGPLGSGKTSLLQQLAAFLTGTRLFLVNDVGEINIDARRLSAVGQIIPFSSGCIVCSSADQFEQYVQQALDANVDWLVIEPTGSIDARELSTVLAKHQLEWTCIALINARDFEMDLADGVLPMQVPVATVIGATHSEGVDLGAVERYIGNYNLPYVVIPNPDEQRLAQTTAQILLASKGVPEDYTATLVSKRHTHAHAGHSTHSHGAYALSLELLPWIGLDELEIALSKVPGLLRAKGVLKHEGQQIEFDAVRTSVVSLGAMADDVGSHLVVITKERLDPQVLLNIGSVSAPEVKTKMQHFKALQDPATTEASIRRWLTRFPSVLRQDGRLRVRCEAFLILTLALRKNVSAEVRQQAIWQYASWLADSIRLLPEVEGWFSAQEVGGWKFLLGKFLSRITVEEFHHLLPEQVAEIRRLNPIKLLLEGLAALDESVTKDVNLYIDVQQWPQKSGLSLTRGSLQWEPITANEAVTAYHQTLTLLERLNSPYLQDWRDMIAGLEA